jgi:hypothetical protein
VESVSCVDRWQLQAMATGGRGGFEINVEKIHATDTCRRSNGDVIERKSVTTTQQKPPIRNEKRKSPRQKIEVAVVPHCESAYIIQE